MLNDVLEELQVAYDSTLGNLRRELQKVRTGRANASMLNNIKIDYYGTPTPLNQVGAIKVPDPRMITIQPWEKNVIATIERAILTADLGLNPSNDGTLIRLPVPALTTDRRRELSRQVKEMGERAKVAARNQRRDANDMLRMLEKESEISEDQMHNGLAKVQSSTDETTKKIDEIVTDKEKEIMEI